MDEDRNSVDVVARCRAGDQKAAAELHSHFVQRLVGLAKSRLSRKLNPRLDAEDIVQSAFCSFFGRLKEGQFDIRDTDDLWNLLSRITLNKTLKQIDFHHRLRRSASKEAVDGNRERMLTIFTSEPTPDQAAQFIDELEHFLRQMDPEDRQIVELRLEGYANAQIAEKLQISDRKIRRLMERMRDLADMDRLLF